MLHLMEVIESSDFILRDTNMTFQSQAEFVKDKNHNPGKYETGRYTFWDDRRPIFDLVTPPTQFIMKIVEPEERP